MRIRLRLAHSAGRKKIVNMTKGGRKQLLSIIIYLDALRINPLRRIASTTLAL